jgi:hypothetical protein
VSSNTSGQLIDIWSREALGKNPAELDRYQNLNTPENRSLALAKHEDFFSMCKDILWGNEDEEIFGELLRGVVTTFLPTDRFQLSMLHNVVAIQWQIQRVVGIQHNLFDRGSTTPGAYRLPQGTHDAMKYGDVMTSLLDNLNTAIETYRSMCRTRTMALKAAG